MAVSVEALVGRAREVDWLRERIGAAAFGQGGAAALLGPPGIGKSALLAAAVEAARAEGFGVARASGGELEREWAHGVVRQLLTATELRVAAASGADAGLRSVLEPRAAEADESVVAHGLWAVLAEAAEDKPLLVVVDDLHWVDAPSLRLLGFVARRVEDLPLLLLGAARRPWDEQAADPAATALLSVCQTLALEPLDGQAVAELAASTLDADPEAEFVEACRLSTGGNPFYLSELLHELRHRGLQPDAQGAEAVPVLGPERVADAAAVRCAAAGPDAVALAQVVAILGGATELRLGAALAGLDRERAVLAADALAAAALLRPGSPLAFRHPVLRAAIVDRIPALRRGELHAAAARLVAQEGASATEVAGHVLAAPPAGSPDNVRALRAAAEEALAGGAPEAAITLLRRALAEPPAVEERTALEVELALAEAAFGDAHAAERLSSLVWRPDLADEQFVEVARALGVEMFRVQRADEFRQFAEDLRPRLAALPALSQLRLETETLFGLYGVDGRPPDLDARLARIDRLAEENDGREARCLQAVAHAQVTSVQGSTFAELQRWAMRAIEHGGLEGRGALGRTIARSLIVDLMNSGGEDLASAAVEQLLGEARRESPAAYSEVLDAKLNIAYQRGDLRAVEQLAASLPSGPSAPSGLDLWTEVRLLLYRGRLGDAETVFEDRPQRIDRWTTRANHLLAEADLRLAQRRYAEALQAGIALHDLFTSQGDPGPTAGEFRLPLALRGLDRIEDAVAAADRTFAGARRWGAPELIGRALQLRGLMTENGGLAVALLEEAVSTLRPTVYRLRVAEALVDYGAALRRANRRLEARDALREGLELALACDATALADRARDELRAAGGRLRRERTSGADALTPAERRIAYLAAEGFSNPEIARTLFLSRRTVENQLSRAYRKLDITAREQLADALGQPASTSGPS